MYNQKSLEQEQIEVANKQHVPIETIVTWEKYNELLASHVDAIDLIQQLQTALAFYSDETKYYYARKDHPNTRLAEDSGEIARKALRQ